MPEASNEAMLDKNVSRNRAARTLVGLVILSLEIVTFVAIGLFLASFLGWPFGGLALAASVYGGGLMVATTIPWITAQVQYPWGLVTQNYFTGRPVIYGPGLHFKFPWETVTERSNISLEDRTTIKPGLTIASKTDSLKVKISFQWRADLKSLATFYRMEDSTVGALFEPIERFVSSIFAHMEAEEARESQATISRLLLAAFRGTVEAAIEKIPADFPNRDIFVREERLFGEEVRNHAAQFGIHVVQVNVSDIDFSDDVQKARGARNKLQALQEMYYQSAGGKDAYDALSVQDKAEIQANMRVISGDATEKQINFRGNRPPDGGVMLSADDK